MNWIKKHIKLLLNILAIVVAYLILSHFFKFSVADVLSFISDNPVLALLVLVGLYLLKSFITVIPVITLYITAGLLFPTHWAYVITYSCLFIEITIGYIIGRKIGKEKIERIINKSRLAQKLVSFQSSNMNLSCVIARILPIPMEITSIYFASFEMNYLKYLIFSFLGLTPALIPYVLAANSISTPLSKEFLIPFVIAVSITVSICLIAAKIQKTNNVKNEKIEETKNN